MGKRVFKDYICRPFCRFFREGRKEELACRGAVLIEQLVKKDVLQPGTIPGGGKTPRLWSVHHPVLQAFVCNRCEFQPDGCDFQARTPPPHAEPCGGYILLSLLLQQGRLSTRDLEELSGA